MKDLKHTPTGWEIKTNEYGVEMATLPKEKLVNLIESNADLLEALNSLRGLEPWIGDRKMQRYFHETVNQAIKKATL